MTDKTTKEEHKTQKKPTPIVSKPVKTFKKKCNPENPELGTNEDMTALKAEPEFETT